METKDLIKYAAMAGAAYLVYEWWRSHAVAIAAVGAGEVGTGAGTAATTGTTVTSAGKPTGATGGATANDNLIRLAIDEAYAIASWPGPTLSADQWNYYRTAGGKPIYDAGVLMSFGVAPDRSRPIVASEYHSRMTIAAGQGATTLSGLGMAGLGFSIWQARMPGDYSWLM